MENINLLVTVGGIQKAQSELKTLTEQINRVRAAIEKVSQTDGKRIGFGNDVKTIEELYKMESQLTKQRQAVQVGYQKSQEAERKRELAQTLAYEKELRRRDQEYQKYLRGEEKTTARLNEAERKRALAQTAAQEKHISEARARQNQQALTQIARDEEAARRQRSARAQRGYAEESQMYQKYFSIASRAQMRTDAGVPLSRLDFTKAKRDLAEIAQRYKELTGRDISIRNPLAGFGNYSEYIERSGSSLRSFRRQIDELSALRQDAWINRNTAAFTQYNRRMQEATRQHGLYNRAIGNTTNYLGSLGQKLRSHMNWIIAGSLIEGIVSVPTKIVGTIKEIETAMAGMNQVMDHNRLNQEAATLGIDGHTYAQQKLNEESNKFIEIAAVYGEKTTDIIEAGKLWGRLYKDLDIVNTLTGQSAKLAVADNFSLIEANKSLEAAMFQYGMTAKNTTEALAYSGRIIDVWTKLAHTAGASAQDLTQAVQRTGSVAKLTGVDFEFLNAMIATAVRSTGRSGAEIGNMVKSVLGSFHSSKAIAEIEKLGVAVYKVGENGEKQYRKAQDVLLDLAVTAQGSSENLENLFKQIAGGKFQWAKAAAMLGDYKEFIRTWGEAVNSTGFTAPQIEMQMDTIARKVATLKADLDGLFVGMGNAGLAKAVKEWVDSLDRVVLTLRTIPADAWGAMGSMAKWGIIILTVKKALESTRDAIASFKLARAGMSVATAAETAAEVANATARSASTMATGANSVAEGANVIVRGAQTVATNTATVATSRLAVATAFATGGLSLILPLIAAVGGGFYFFADGAGEAEQALRKKTRAAEDGIAVENQRLEMSRQQDELISALISSYQRLTEQIDSGTLTQEKAKQAEENRQATIDELTKLIGEEGVASLKTAGWTEEACDKEKKAHALKTDEIKKGIKEAKASQLELTRQQVQNTVDRIDMLKSEVAAWGWWANVVKGAVDLYAGFRNMRIAAIKFRLEHDTISFTPDNVKKQLQNDLGVLEKEAEDAKNYRPGWITEDIEKSEADLLKLSKELLELQIAINKDTLVDYHTTPVGGNNVPSDDGSDDPKDTKVPETNKSTPYEQPNIESIYANYDAIKDENFGEVGCTAAVKKLLTDSSFIQSTDLWVPNWMQKAKGPANLWADASEGGRPGDVAVIETNNNPDDGPDHVVVVVENGGYIGNSTSAAKQGNPSVVKGQLSEYGENIVGYIRTGNDFQYNHFNTEKWQINKDKMEQQKLFLESEIAAKRYEAALSTLNARESLYGKTVTGTVAMLDLMRVRRKALNDDEWQYTEMSKRKQQELDAQVQSNSVIVKMLQEQGVEWKNLTKEEQGSLVDKSKLSKAQQDRIKNLNTLVTQYTKKAEEVRSKKIQIDNELLKSNFEGVFDQDKIFQRRGEDIDRNTHIQKNDMDTYTDPDYREQMRKIDHTAALEKQQLATRRVTKAEKEYAAALATIPAIVETKTAALAAAREELSKLDPTSEAYAQTERKIIDLTNELASAQAGVTNQTIQAKEALDKEKLALSDAGVEVRKYADKFQEIREKGADVFSRLIVDGQSWHDIMKDLWADFAKDAIRRLFQVQNAAQQTSFLGGLMGGGGGILGMISGLFGGGKSGAGSWEAMGGFHNIGIDFLSHNGGEVFKMHSGGRVMTKPTLKDDEVVRTLQVGERVLSKKDNQAFESFMPRFADLSTKGSAMVPDFNPEIMAQTKTVIAETKQTSAQISEIKRTNELLVSVLTKMSNKGNDGITVVSTRMSDQEIIGALQRNPAALQALMGRNRNMGYR